MATIIECSFPIEEFALEETLNTHPEAHIEIERVVADNSDHLTPYMWVRTDEPNYKKNNTGEETCDCEFARCESACDHKRHGPDRAGRLYRSPTDSNSHI